MKTDFKNVMKTDFENLEMSALNKTEMNDVKGGGYWTYDENGKLVFIDG